MAYNPPILGITILPVKDMVKYILLGVVLVSMFLIINRLPEGALVLAFPTSRSFVPVGMG